MYYNRKHKKCKSYIMKMNVDIDNTDKDGVTFPFTRFENIQEWRYSSTHS